MVLVPAALAVLLPATVAQAQVPAWQWSSLGRHAATQAPARARAFTAAGVVDLTYDAGAKTAKLTLTTAKKAVSWRVSLATGGANQSAVTHHKGRVFVAIYRDISSGAVVHAFDLKKGRRLWRHSLRALGPIGHSQYLNQIHLALHKGNLVVYGNESGGRYIEVRGAARGRLLAHQKVPPSVGRLPWSWTGKPGKHRWYVRPVRLPASGGGAYVFTNRKNHSESVARQHPLRKRRWSTKLPGSGFCGNAAMVAHRKILYVVQFCQIATGATLHAVGKDSGKLLWSKRLIGIGPIAHSRYANDVQVQILDGKVIVYGMEASGRYIEARDVVDGHLISSRSFR